MSPDISKLKPGDEAGRPGHGLPLNLVVLTADLVGYSELVFRDVQNSISVLRETRASLPTASSHIPAKFSRRLAISFWRHSTNSRGPAGRGRRAGRPS